MRRDGLFVRGPEAADWLQGQLTQDLQGMALGESRFSLVLSPQGKLDSFCRVTRTADDSFLLDTEEGYGDGLESRLRRFKLRVKVELEPVQVVSSEAGTGRLDALGPPRVTTDPPAARRGDESALEEARIRAGRPRLGRELTERTIPQEAGEAFVARTVSFEKGCYTGQELVARLDARGSNVPRRLRLIEGRLPAPPPAEKTALWIGDEEVGEVTSAARSGDSFVALGYLKRSAAGREPLEVELGRREGPRTSAVVSLLPPEL